MALISIDPSSSCTGLAWFSDTGKLEEMARFKPNGAPLNRCYKMGKEVAKRVQQLYCENDTVLIEVPGLQVGKNSGAGLITLGAGIGAVYAAIRDLGISPIEVEVRQWAHLGSVRLMPKNIRQQQIAARFPQYDWKKDKGADIADAIGLGWVWLEGLLRSSTKKPKKKKTTRKKKSRKG